MGSAPIDLAKLPDWRLPAGLAGGSLVPALLWRLLPDAGGWLTDVFGVAAVGVIVGQSLVGSENVGLALAWLLTGVLTYQYTPVLYPESFKKVVTPRGFRALTAVGTLYFGLFSWGAIIPVAVPWRAASGSAQISVFIITMIGGLVAGGLTFTLYFTRWQDHALAAEESALTAAMGRFFRDDYLPVEASGRDRYGDLPSRWQLFVHLQMAASFAVFPASVCLVGGLVGVVLNLFYPLPEAVLFVGFGALRLLSDDVLSSDRGPSYEVDLRLLDSISGATRNLKGTVMVIYSFVGMALSGIVFLSSVGFIATAFSSTGNGGTNRFVPILAAVTVVIAHLMMGIYSLVHWLRQLERVEPYAHSWETAADETRAPPVTRPPGLLLPAHLPLVAVAVGGVLTALTSRQVAFGTVAGLSIMATGLMIGGLAWAWRHEPQSHSNESRDLLVTLLLQVSLYLMLFGLIDWEAIRLRTGNLLIAALMLVMMVSIFQFPDINRRAAQREGVWRLLDIVSVVLVALALLWIVSMTWESTILTVFILVLLATGLLSSVAGFYLEWRFERE